MGDKRLATVSPEFSLAQRVSQKSAPAIFADTGYIAKTFWEFFAVTIRNKGTREAYLRACFRFADWCEAHQLTLEDIEPFHVAAYIEQLCNELAAPTVKLHLTSIRRLFDYLVTHQVIAMNPSHAVKAPSHSVRKGKTPILSVEEMRQLFDSISLGTISGYRDRAIIATMAYSFARVSAVCKLTQKDYYTQASRSYFRLNEKGGKYNVVPAHHTVQRYVDEYLEQGGWQDEKRIPLFRALTLDRKSLQDSPLTRDLVFRMIKRRCRQAGLSPEICNHSFRGTGITTYMENGGTLENAATIAGHASTTTTQLYDRRSDEITLDEIERIRY